MNFYLPVTQTERLRFFSESLTRLSTHTCTKNPKQARQTQGSDQYTTDIQVASLLASDS